MTKKQKISARAAKKRWREKHPDKVRMDARRPHYRYQRLKHQSKTRGIELQITFLEWRELTAQEECFYDQSPLPPTSHGLDRLDNQKGYVIGNVVPCCTSCNRRKGGLEQAGFRFPRIMELMRELRDSDTKLLQR